MSESDKTRISYMKMLCSLCVCLEDGVTRSSEFQENIQNRILEYFQSDVRLRFSDIVSVHGKCCGKGWAWLGTNLVSQLDWLVRTFPTSGYLTFTSQITLAWPAAMTNSIESHYKPYMWHWQRVIEYTQLSYASIKLPWWLKLLKHCHSFVSSNWFSAVYDCPTSNSSDLLIF